ncbi:MAG: DUF1972 domain-containing protein [Alloprevotella sp.]
MKHVAIIGSQGLPAHYGGFETLVENIVGRHRSPGVAYTVFCAARDYTTRLETYKGARLKYIPFFHANGIHSTPYDVLSLCRCLRGYDAVVALGVSGGLFMPLFKLLFRGKLIVNIDGREHSRAKWGRFAKTYLKMCERFAVCCADTVIADNKGIQDYVAAEYRKPSALIAYGGDHALRSVPETRQQDILRQYGLTPKSYALAICRIEPENNCHLTLEVFAENGRELVFVGNWAHSAYGHEMKERYAAHANIHMLESEYNLDTLFTLRRHAALYVHGHSAGGTNPSLVEAMFFGNPILAYDAVYNRASTFSRAYYYKTAADLQALLARTDLNGSAMREIAGEHYTWQAIARKYEALY